MTTPDRLVRAAGVSPPIRIHRPPGIPVLAKTIRAGHCLLGRCAIRSSAAASAASRAAAGTSQGLTTPPLVTPTTTGSSISGKPAQRRSHHAARLTLPVAHPHPHPRLAPSLIVRPHFAPSLMVRRLIARLLIARLLIGRASPQIDRLEAAGRALPAAPLSLVISAGSLTRLVLAALPRSGAGAVAPDVCCLVATRPRPPGRPPTRHRPPKTRPPKPQPPRLRLPRPLPLQLRPLPAGAGRQRRPLLLAPAMATAGQAASPMRPTPTTQAG
jgi:hypothetical protein